LSLSDPGLISVSGGLAWHAKAVFRHRGLWANFLGRIEQFLLDWELTLRDSNPKATSGLLLIGPSGGWCLPKSGFLDRFPSVVAVDPDPLAEKIFLKRHPSVAGQEQVWVPSTFERVLPALLARHPHHAVLFCNVLGQLRYQPNKTIERIEFELNQVKQGLRGRHWASFHDRISGPTASTIAGELEFFEPQRVLTEDLGRRVANGGEWLDHLTEQVLPDTAGRRLIAWPISKIRTHWVEAGWVSPDNGK
jgi:hypothetical protein